MKRRATDVICADSYKRHWYRDANSEEMPLCARCMAPNPRWPLAACAFRSKVARSRHVVRSRRMVRSEFCGRSQARHVDIIKHEFTTAARSSFLESAAVRLWETKKRSGR